MNQSDVFQTVVYREAKVGRTDPRLFGTFVEHMGSVVYNGIYQKGGPLSNDKGYRTDVLRLLQQLNFSVLRYPGGNFTSAYRWEDSVGRDRQATLNYAWRELEPNEFGLHEYADWASNFENAQTMMTLNLGTRGALEAVDLLEYCNHPSGTKMSELRRKNGADKPFGFKMWCLGNELDGEWQMGHMPAKEYGRLADVTAQLMRQLDPELELACVGSSNITLDNYPEWNRKVLMQCYDQVDYITLHKYLTRKDVDLSSYLCLPLQVDGMIETVASVCDYVASCKRSKRRVNISFDEWNVGPVEPDGTIGEWLVGPSRDCVSFTFADTLVFAGMMTSLLRHADRVKIACESLIVNCNGLVLTEDGGAYPNGSYPVFKLFSDLARGTVMQSFSSGAALDTTSFDRQPALDTLVVRADDGKINAFAINRTVQDVVWKLRLPEETPLSASASILKAPLDARNSLEHPDTISLRPGTAPALSKEQAEGIVPAYSLCAWTIDVGE